MLASTQELHEKISELANRVRELEVGKRHSRLILQSLIASEIQDALRSSHAQLSPESHPLLSEELLRIKAPLQREVPAFRNAANSLKEEENNPDVVDAFGSLSISLSGRAKYFGQTAGAWVSTLSPDTIVYLLTYPLWITVFPRGQYFFTKLETN